jgi:hypothetical protein
MDLATQTYLTNDARRQELRIKIAKLKGEMIASSSLSQSIASLNNDAQTALSAAQSELATLEAGGGPGATSDFGPYSTTDQALQNERTTGKSALIDYIKLNTACLEADAIAQWKTAALKGRPVDRQWLLHDPQALRYEYSANLVALKYVVDNTWASFRAWVVATAKTDIMGL